MVTPKPMDAGSVTTRQEKTYGGISDHPDCLSNDRCNPEQMRGTLTLQGGEEVSSSFSFCTFSLIPILPK